MGKPEEGTVTIETVDPDVELVFNSGGRDFIVKDTKTGKETKLPLGTYQVKLKDDKEGLKLNTNQFTLMTRDDRALVKVTWKAGDQPKSARTDIPAPFQVAEPPPLAEWLKGRTILTVSQDGKSQFKTIQAALNALKPHQVVKVLDRGPYRERLVLEPPDDCGLVSEQATVLELSEWKPPWKEGTPSQGHYLGVAHGFRLSGFVLDWPKKTAYGFGLQINEPDGFVVENCWFRSSSSSKWGVSLHIGWGREAKVRPFWMRECVFEGMVAVNAQNRFAEVVIQRNYFLGEGKVQHVSFAEDHYHRAVIRENVFSGRPINFEILFQKAKEIRELEISNNTTLSAGPLGFAVIPLEGSVRIRNNLRARPGLVVMDVGAESGMPQAVKNWQVGNNAFPRQLAEPEQGLEQKNIFPQAPTDIVAAARFLSDDPTARDYLRLPEDSPLCKGGTGAAWPSYIGALPPGPAPKDGDWFTRLRQRWGNLAPAAKPPSPPVQIPEPPPLAEWLKGRTILTVSQDGKSQFKTIQAALNALKPGQVVKVLDRGPYRERLSLFVVPEDTGLVSEHQTVLELSEWLESDKKEPIGHYFRSAEDFRVHGFALIFPTSPKDGIAFYVPGPNGFVLENCFVQVPEKAELMAAVMIGLWVGTDWKPAWVRDCTIRGKLIFASKKPSATVVAERNYLDGPADQALQTNGNFAKVVIRHNVFGTRVTGATLAIGEMKEVDSLEVRNNTTTSIHPLAFAFSAPRKNVTILNNLRSQPGLLVFGSGAEKELPAIIESWRVGHNAYPHQLRQGEIGWLGKQNIVPQAPTDLLGEPKFLSLDPAHSDYLRLAADSPQAKGGANGVWPSYIGALPPGPAPKDGDWFTRLRAKWTNK